MRKKIKSIVTSIVMLLVTTTLCSQNIAIDSTFTSDAIIYPFDTTQAIYGLSVNCSVELNSDTSLVRLVMVDTNYNEYMVYEAYPLIVSNDTIIVEDTCDESCYLDGVVPYLLEIQIINSSIDLDTLNLKLNSISDADSLRVAAKLSIEYSKMETMNDNLHDNSLWGADTNGRSNLWYFEKVEKYGNKYNLIGFDYYSAGCYSSKRGSYFTKDSSDMIPIFSWVNRHGANDTNSAYYNWEHGWLTTLKNQNDLCENTCWIFSAIGALEACINLYFNKTTLTDFIQINVSLSEQHVLSCNEDDNMCEEGAIYVTHNFIIDSGVVDIDCCPYHSNPTTKCSELEKCSSPDYKISAISRSSVDYKKWDSIKKAIIHYGPIPGMRTKSTYGGGVNRHAMAIVGYQVIKVGDTINRGSNLDPVIIESDSEWKNTVSLQFKDSYEVGVYYESINLYPNMPYISNTSRLISLQQNGSESLVRMCLDLDKDGYYNWGIGNKPVIAPYCHDNIDSDDSNPRIGLWDSNYYGQAVAPIMSVKYNPQGFEEIDIENNSIITIPDSDTAMRFIIFNLGNAQLNLFESEFTGERPIVINLTDSIYFELDEPDSNFIRISGLKYDSRSFTIHDTASYISSKKIKVTIELDEPDIDDFIFYLVKGDCTTLDTTEYITSDTTWSDFDVKFWDVVVCDSSVLNITSTIGFSENADLKIGQGSKVIINGGRLTKACNGLWQGVDVYGDSDSSQAYSQFHGTLELENEGTIEYALTGAETKYLPNQRDFTGGIITGNHANFRNNVTDIKLLPFINTRPLSNDTVDNLSGFTYCKFYTDSLLYGLNEDPDSHIDFTGTSGVYLTSCDFYNTHVPDGDSITLGDGIYSIDSKYFVKSACIESDPSTGECLKYDTTQFQGLDYGIYSMNSRSNVSPMVELTNFNGNKTGIYLSQTPQASVTLCDFDVRKMNYDNSENEIFCGVYVNSGCDGFQVEENYFYNSDNNPLSGSDSTIGIVVNNSGAVSNEVYNNYFEDLDFGVSAQGSNKGDSVGLQILCNDFDTCRYDIAVVPDTSRGIAYSQGSNSTNPEDMAGNLFYIPSQIPDDDYDDINNEGEDIIYYYPTNAPYDQDRIEPVDYTINTVTNYEKTVIPDWESDSGCPSNLVQGSGGIENLRLALFTIIEQIDSTQNILATLIDGGNTEELQKDVEFSTPPESMDIYNELMNKSPYLSDTVVSTAIGNEETLPNTMIRDIMVANPNTAKLGKLMDKLDERLNPLPDYMKSQILLGRSILSIREETESFLHKLKSRKARYLNKLIRYYSKDTLNPGSSADSILAIYKNAYGLSARYTLVLEFVERGDSTNAINVLDSIPTNFNLSTTQVSEHQNYEDYLKILNKLMEDGKNIFQADSADKAQLYNLYENSTGNIHDLIRNVLLATDTLIYSEPYIFPDFLKSSIANNDFQEITDKKHPAYLQVHPNPSLSYVIIEYKKEMEKSGYINIHDLGGKLITSLHIANGNEQKLLDIRDWEPGVYVATIIIGDEYIESEKFMIIK